MVKPKKLQVNTTAKRTRNVKVPKLDAEVSSLSVPSDISQLTEHWNEAAQRLLQLKVNNFNEALSAFIEIIVEGSDLSGDALQDQRNFLFDMLSLDEDFKEELKSMLKLKG